MDFGEEHILVCLSSSPSNAKIIRTAARMYGVFHGTFTALYVKTSSSDVLDPQNQKRLQDHMQLAQDLGATVETVYGDDVPLMIAEFVRLSNVTKIVIGRSIIKRHFFRKLSLSEQLLTHLPDMEIHIIPDQNVELPISYRAILKKNVSFALADTAKSLGILTAASALGIFFKEMGFAEANVIMIYLFAVLLISVMTEHRAYSFFSSIASVLIFNFLFTSPQFSLTAYDKDYPLTFFIMFISALLTGSLAARLKSSAQHSAQTAVRMKILFDTNQRLQKALTIQDIYDVTAQELLQLLHRDIILYPVTADHIGAPLFYPENANSALEDYTTDEEKKVILWTKEHLKHASSATSPYSDAECIYYAIKSHDSVAGILGVAIRNRPWDEYENAMLLSILGECALALENRKNAYEKEQAAIRAKNEQLRANLLRAISHDLRTPLTSISGNASNLLYNGDSFDVSTKLRLYQDIYDDSMWLINLVENLLSVTRLEEGRLQLHICAELVEEVISEALRHANRLKSEHDIIVDCPDELLLAKMDARLIVQVLINLIDNAIKYTPPGSRICVRAIRKDDWAEISVEDNGNGILDEHKAHVFEMFYTCTDKIVDSRKSLGLGLFLCKAIINAHGGSIHVADNVPHGTVFRFTLPIEEVSLNG